MSQYVYKSGFTECKYVHSLLLASFHGEGGGDTAVGRYGFSEYSLAVAKVLYSVVSGRRGRRDGPRDSRQALSQ